MHPLIQSVDELLPAHGTVESRRIRTNEAPHSAFWHITVNGQEFIVMVQPTGIAPVDRQEP